MEETYALELRDISKRFGSVQANDHVNLTLRKSEILAILGENGSCKTTLMNMIYGIYYPDEGHIFVNGKEVTIRSPKDSYELGIGMVHQHFKLVDVLTAAENIVLGLPGKGKLDMKRITEDIQKLADKYGFELDLSQKIYEMSVSQKQTVEIVKVLFRGADILILDEPTSYLDVRHKLEFLSILQKLCRERELTVILSLHELELAEKISDRILCVNGRAVDRIGTPEEVMTDGYITQLYGIRMGSYDEASSDMELAAPEGTPQVFVIAGAGSGRKDYRRLQRAGVPFATGILYENDLDYPVAKALAVEVIAEHPFEPVVQETLQAAKERLEKCDHVICCRENFGSLEIFQRELLEYARQLGKRIESSGQQNRQ